MKTKAIFKKKILILELNENTNYQKIWNIAKEAWEGRLGLQ